jgi:hypothetical protein
MMMYVDVQGLGQALGSPLEEARETHPRALIETNAQHKVGSRKETIIARNETYHHRCRNLVLDVRQGRFGSTSLERLAV